MIAGICLGIMVMFVLLKNSAKNPPRLESNELLRLRRLSDRLHREDAQPFE